MATLSPTDAPAYLALRRDVLINADLWSDSPKILAAGYGFEGIIGVPGLNTAADLGLAVTAGAGVNLDYARLDPTPPLRNLTSASSPQGVVLAGYGAAPVFADAMPIEFSWPILPSSVSPKNIEITLNTGATVTPSAAGLNPNYDYNERGVIVVFGEFGNRIAPGSPGAVYPVKVTIVAGDAPLMAVGPAGPVSLTGLSSPSSNPYVAGPSLVGAKLTRMSVVGDFAPRELSGASPNDAVSLYGGQAQYRLRLYTSGGFSPDGVSGLLPTEFSRYFSLEATDAAGRTVAITQAGVDYDLGLGKLRVVGLAELGAKADGASVTYGPYYVEDHDNYFDVVVQGDEAAVARLTRVDIPTSARPGYSDLYNPGGPGRTPTAGVTYTRPALPQSMPITNALASPLTVSYAAQSLSAYDQADDLPVVFRLYRPATGDHLYTDSSIEAGAAVLAGYKEEGAVFAADSGQSLLASVYRFDNQATGHHVYTASEAERRMLAADGSGFAFKGVAFAAYAAPTPGAQAVYRFFSPATGDRLYTADRAEGLASGYQDEGVAWYSGTFGPAASGAGAAASMGTESLRQGILAG